VPQNNELPAQLYGDELERLKRIAERRGVTPEELLSSEITRGLSEMTRPKVKRGNVKPFRRKPE
jgi:cytidylate kinase